MRALTDVESCALGVVWQKGPCTAYTVRREFAISSTPRWSASAGSIYPALRRLLQWKLVRAEEQRWGPRGKTRFSITARGLERLRAWVLPPFAGALGGPAFDPLRTRACFLGALDRRARRRFVVEAGRATRAALAEVRAKNPLRAPKDDYDAFAGRGSELELRARLQWLTELRRFVAP